VSQGYANTPWATFRNPPFEAHCNPGQTQCTAKEWSALAYLNHPIGEEGKSNDLSHRTEAAA
jgi:hypothetical protein